MSWAKLTLRVDEDWLWAVKGFAVKTRQTVTDLVIDAVNAEMDKVGHEYPPAKGQEDESES